MRWGRSWVSAVAKRNRRKVMKRSIAIALWMSFAGMAWVMLVGGSFLGFMHMAPVQGLAFVRSIPDWLWFYGFGCGVLVIGCVAVMILTATYALRGQLPGTRLKHSPPKRRVGFEVIPNPAPSPETQHANEERENFAK